MKREREREKNLCINRYTSGLDLGVHKHTKKSTKKNRKREGEREKKSKEMTTFEHDDREYIHQQQNMMIS